MDLIQEIQDRNYNKFVGVNEADLATREEIADLWGKEFVNVSVSLLPLDVHKKARELSAGQFIDWWFAQKQ